MKNKSLKRLSEFRGKNIDLPKDIFGGKGGFAQSHYYQDTNTWDNCADQATYGDGPIWGYIGTQQTEFP